MVERLDSLNQENINAYVENEQTFLRFGSEAQEHFNFFSQCLEEKLSDSKLEPALDEHFSKYRSLMPSLALIFHLLKWAESPHSMPEIGVEETEMAARFCDFLELHAIKIYSMATNQEAQSAKELIKKINEGKIFDKMKVRDIYMKHWKDLKTRSEIEPALAVLEDCNWIKIDEVSGDMGRSSKIIRLNPKFDGIK
jgi:hypothetical protein